MDNYKIGALVQVEITEPGWETTIISTIVGTVRGANRLEWHLAIRFDVYADDDTLEGEQGFTTLSNGKYVTIPHSLHCIVTAL